MLVPDFAVQIACDIGLPLNVARALTGFYRGQIKIFKIGRFYGRKVFSKNSAIQGCSMSILMVNAFYSIMTRAMTNQFHHVSIATFIDDANIWSSFHYRGDPHMRSLISIDFPAPKMEPESAHVVPAVSVHWLQCGDCDAARPRQHTTPGQKFFLLTSCSNPLPLDS